MTASKDIFTSAAPHLYDSVFGTIAPETYQINSKDTFTPWMRTVFVGQCSREAGGGFYITSHIRGRLHRHRSRCCAVVVAVEIANIFGGGCTLTEALKNFADNFTASPKIYNRTSIRATIDSWKREAGIMSGAQKITYKRIKNGEEVYLDGKKTGEIKSVLQGVTSHGGQYFFVRGWAYYPKGSKSRGDVFASVTRVKQSLERE